MTKKMLRDLLPDELSYVKHIGYQDELIFLFNQSLSLVKQNSPGFRKILAGIVLQLVAYVAFYETKKVKTREEGISLQTSDYIRQNLSQDIDFKKLANEYHLSYNRFRTIFKNETGVSLQQYLIHERLENAKRCNLYSHFTIICPIYGILLKIR